MALALDEWQNINTTTPFNNSGFAQQALASTSSGQSFATASRTPTQIGCVPVAYGGMNDFCTVAPATAAGWVSDGAAVGNGTTFVNFCGSHGPAAVNTSSALSENISNTSSTTYSFPSIFTVLLLLNPPAGGGGGTAPAAPVFVPFPLGGAGGTSAGSAALRKLDREIRRRYR